MTWPDGCGAIRREFASSKLLRDITPRALAGTACYLECVGPNLKVIRDVTTHNIIFIPAIIIISNIPNPKKILTGELKKNSQLLISTFSGIYLYKLTIIFVSIITLKGIRIKLTGA